MIDLEKIFKKYYLENEKIILACSGGPDSIFLLDKIIKSKYKNNTIVVYFNHGLRTDAFLEEKFIQNICDLKNIVFKIGRCDIFKKQKELNSISLEELARNERYTFMRKIKEEYNAKYILTGHHLDDKIETFLFNLFRGSKLTGLINMTEVSGDILRPLLNLEKQAISEYLDENNIEYKTDFSNFDSKITRNFLRNELIPQFYKINKSFKKNIQNTLTYFEEVKNNIDIGVINFLDDRDFFIINDFLELTEMMQKELIRYCFYIKNNNSTIGLSQANIAEIIKFINGKNNKTIKNIKNLKMKKDNNKIYF